jgi:hypothetical protein
VKRYADYPARAYRPRAVLQPTNHDDVTADVPLGLEPLSSAGRGRASGIEAFIQKKLSEVPVYALLSVSANRTRFAALDGVTSRGAFDDARHDAGPRLAPFFAVDARIDRRFAVGRGQLVTYLDFQDLTARRNATFPVFNERSGRVERQLVAGFLPSIGVTWER